MGACSSRQQIRAENTAKLVLTDGTLQEFSCPVKVSLVMQKIPKCFLCDSDEMDFDNAVSAIDGDDELRPGKLYFALPLSRLNRRIPAEEMASLAVKATSAMMKSGGGGDPWGCYDEKVVFPCGKTRSRVSDGGGCGDVCRRGRRNGGGKRKFTAELSAITE